MAIPDYEFSQPIAMQDLNDTDARCDFGVGDDGRCNLDMVTILGKPFSRAEILDWLGQCEIDRLEYIAQQWWSVDGGCEVVERDYADRRADDRRNMEAWG